MNTRAKFLQARIKASRRWQQAEALNGEPAVIRKRRKILQPTVHTPEKRESWMDGIELGVLMVIAIIIVGAAFLGAI